MGFFQGIGTKLNRARHIGAKVLHGAAMIGVKLGQVASVVAPIIAARNPMIGGAIRAAGAIVGGVAKAAQHAQAGDIGAGVRELGAVKNTVDAIRGPGAGHYV